MTSQKRRFERLKKIRHFEIQHPTKSLFSSVVNMNDFLNTCFGLFDEICSGQCHHLQTELQARARKLESNLLPPANEVARRSWEA